MIKTRRQLFKAIDGADGNVVLNFQGSPKNELEVLGAAYHRAGRSLVAQFSSQPGYHDFDGCPIASLYRQALELLIKAVLASAWSRDNCREQALSQLCAFCAPAKRMESANLCYFANYSNLILRLAAEQRSANPDAVALPDSKGEGYKWANKSG